MRYAIRILDARAVAVRFRIQRHCSQASEIFDMPDIDAVGVCTDPCSHASLAIAAMQTGKLVWVDKPLALCSEDCVRLVKEAARTGVTAMTGFHMRFHRLVLQARDLIRRGELGPIQCLRSVWHSPRADGNLPAWRRHRGSGGGALVEIAVHHLDLCRYLMGSEIEELFAAASDGVRDDECATISARMSNSVLVTAELSERAPHEIELVVSGRDALLRVDCLRFDGLERQGKRDVPGAPGMRLLNAGRFLKELPGGLRLMRQGGDYRDSYRRAWRHFARAVRAGSRTDATFEDGLKAVEAVCGAVKSRLTGMPVLLPGAASPVIRSTAEAAVDSSTSKMRECDSGDLTFSVVIPTRNRAFHVTEVLKALSRQHFPHRQFEVILVDDGGSSPLEPVLIPFRESLQLRLLIQDHAGCAAARQKGAEAARGRYLAFTDEDCRPRPDWLNQFAAALAPRPHCAVGGMTANGLKADLYAEAAQFVVSSLAAQGRDSSGYIRYCPTSSVVFPAEEFRGVGGLDRNWHISGGEDRDLCARWLLAGFRLYQAADATVDHYHAMTLRKFLRVHFDYGSGAFLFHKRRSRAAPHGHAFERAGFYIGLLRIPFRSHPWRRAMWLSGLLYLTQLATICGFLWQASPWSRCVAAPDSSIHRRDRLECPEAMK